MVRADRRKAVNARTLPRTLAPTRPDPTLRRTAAKADPHRLQALLRHRVRGRPRRAAASPPSPARRGEHERAGVRLFRPLHQTKSIKETSKPSLTSNDTASTLTGVLVRVQRVLAATAGIWHNDRSALASDSPPVPRVELPAGRWPPKCLQLHSAAQQR